MERPGGRWRTESGEQQVRALCSAARRRSSTLDELVVGGEGYDGRAVVGGALVAVGALPGEPRARGLALVDARGLAGRMRQCAGVTVEAGL